MQDQILFIEMVPTPIWGVSLRRHLPRSAWNRLRQAVLEDCEYRCEVCGADISGKRQAVADEVWNYHTDRSPAVAELYDIQGVCMWCDRIKHLGLTSALIGQGHMAADYMDELRAHFCKVNGASEEEFEYQRGMEFAVQAQLSQHDWTVDWGEYEELVPEAVLGQVFSQDRKPTYPA